MINLSKLEGKIPHLQIFEQFFQKYNIDTFDRITMFLAQCSHESGEFRYTKENLNYSASSLLRVFGKYFNEITAEQYARRPEMIANRVYANRMGNGPESSGDGWKYSGKGFIQCTGKNNYSLFAKYINLSLDDTIEYMETIPGCVESACWFWDINRLNRYADNRDIKTCTRIINGGYNGLEDRIQKYEYYKFLLRP